MVLTAVAAFSPSIVFDLYYLLPHIGGINCTREVLIYAVVMSNLILQNGVG